MTKIGEVTRIESIKAVKCVQCGEWFYYERTTAKYCSATCRKRAKRRHPPTDKYRNNLFTENERFLALIAESNPAAFKKLEYIKNHFGMRALERTLEVFKMLGIQS